jgi:hypothetical protein
MFRKSLSAALFIAIATSALPGTSFAGVMPIADRAYVSVSSPTTQINWRMYPHHRYHWHAGYGLPSYRLAAVYSPATPSVIIRPIYPYECPYYTTPYHGDSIYK